MVQHTTDHGQLTTDHLLSPLNFLHAVLLSNAIVQAEEVNSPEPQSRRLRDMLPHGWLHWTSAILLIAIFELYAGWWAHSNSRALMDPTLQNDDARIHVMPMHRYDGQGTLKDDPVALDMLAYSTLGFRVLYMVFVPLTNVFVATKIVQMICHMLIVACILYLARSDKAGLACGILLGFFMLHTDFVVNRMAGGLSRGFGFPVLAVWLTGAITGKRPIRLAAVVLGAVTYPSAMALVLGTEGIFMLSDGIQLKSKQFWKQAGGYGAVAVLCVGLIKTGEITKPYRGELPTYEEAAANPAFGKYGRTKQIPFNDPYNQAIHFLTSAFKTSNDYRECRPWSKYRKIEGTGPLLLIAMLVMLPFSRLCPIPKPTIALACSSIILYWLARVFAFRLLYIPDRYLRFGMAMTGISLAVSTVGLLWPNVKNKSRRAMLRNFAAIAAIVIMVSLTGDHIEENVQVSVERSEHAQIWDFVNTLPRDIRIAAHPIDADGISFWTGRAATPGDEQLVPWLDEAWQRNKALTERTLTALYATNREIVVSYCIDENITHILLNTKRYEGNIVRKSKTFEPLGAFARGLTAGLKPQDLVLAQPPEEAVILEAQEFKLIDVSKLRKSRDRE